MLASTTRCFHWTSAPVSSAGDARWDTLGNMQADSLHWSAAGTFLHSIDEACRVAVNANWWRCSSTAQAPAALADMNGPVVCRQRSLKLHVLKKQVLPVLCGEQRTVFAQPEAPRLRHNVAPPLGMLFGQEAGQGNGEGRINDLFTIRDSRVLWRANLRPRGKESLICFTGAPVNIDVRCQAIPCRAPSAAACC